MITRPPVRVGIVGADHSSPERHLPDLLAPEGIVVIAEADLGGGVADWRALVARDDLDAVMVGTRPDTRAEISIASLEAGRHVYCEGPIARDLEEARQVARAARRHPRLVGVAGPSPLRTPFDAYIRHLIESGAIGDVTAVDVLSTSAEHNSGRAVRWDERPELVGSGVLRLWGLAAVLQSWVGPYRSLSAVATTPIPMKRDEDGREIRVASPQVVMIAGLLAGGAAGIEYHSSVVADVRSPRTLVTIHGLRGTLRYDFDSRTLYRAGAGGTLEPTALPPQFRSDRSPAARFVEAVRARRDGEPAPAAEGSRFEDALAPLKTLEAVTRSATDGRAIDLASL